MRVKTFLTSLCIAFTAYLSAEDSVVYLHYSQLLPGQVRYSSQNVKQKIEHALKKQDVVWNVNTARHEGKYFNGKSLFPEEEALPVIQAPFGLVLADGHHHTLAAITLQVEWIPIKVMADLSHLTADQFWTAAEQQGWVFLYDLEGNKTAPLQNFDHLLDDPNRYFAAFTARKCLANGDLATSYGAEYPVWIKVGKDIPFIEFRIADVWRQAGIHYDYEMGENPDAAFVEKARAVLINAHIPGLRVVPTRMHYSGLS